MKQVIIHYIRPVPTHGFSRSFSEAEHGEDFESVAQEHATTHATNVREIEGLSEAASKKVAAAKKDAQALAASAPVDTTVGPARLREPAQAGSADVQAAPEKKSSKKGK